MKSRLLPPLPSSLDLIPICWKSNLDLTSPLLLGELGVMSAYFVESLKSLDEFEQSVLMANAEIRRLCAAGSKGLIVGCAAQVALAPDMAQAAGDKNATGDAHE